MRLASPRICNYGDALNYYLWPKVIPTPPGDNTVLYGIGTVLNSTVPPADHYIVFGAGTGYEQFGLPTFDSRWHVYFTRGPLTASVLKCDYLTDPAILLALFHKRRTIPLHTVSFMPRWDATSQELFEACDKAGIHIIDPRWSVPQVIEAIAATGLLLTETLHGAVTADTLRVPWVSIYAERGHESKWYDWTASLDMVWNGLDMQDFTLSWVRDNAVPQLSAMSVLKSRFDTMQSQLRLLNHDIVSGVFE